MALFLSPCEDRLRATNYPIRLPTFLLSGHHVVFGRREALAIIMLRRSVSMREGRDGRRFIRVSDFRSGPISR